MTDPIIKSGLEGIQRAMADAARDAQAVADSFRPDSVQDPVGPLIELQQDLRQAEASAKVVQVGEKLQDEVLDILA